MARLFVALPVPQSISTALASLQNGVPDARWVDEESLHITLCFCGEVDGASMEDLIEALAEIESAAPSLEIAGVDAFADGKRPRALVANLIATPQLDRLQKRIVSGVRDVGISVDRRRFRPHVTLARFSAVAEAGHHLAQFMASHSQFRAGPWQPESFILYSSRPRSEGSVYTAEAEYYFS